MRKKSKPTKKARRIRVISPTKWPGDGSLNDFDPFNDRTMMDNNTKHVKQVFDRNPFCLYSPNPRLIEREAEILRKNGRQCIISAGHHPVYRNKMIYRLWLVPKGRKNPIIDGVVSGLGLGIGFKIIDAGYNMIFGRKK